MRGVIILALATERPGAGSVHSCKPGLVRGRVLASQNRKQAMRKIRAVALVAGALLAAASAFAGAKGPAGRRFEYKSKSAEARKLLFELQDRIENFQFGPENVELAKKIVALDPTFAMGQYYLSAVTPGPRRREGVPEGARAREDGARGRPPLHRGHVPRAREPGRSTSRRRSSRGGGGAGLPRRALGPHHPRPALNGDGAGGEGAARRSRRRARSARAARAWRPSSPPTTC